MGHPPLLTLMARNENEKAIGSRARARARSTEEPSSPSSFLCPSSSSFRVWLLLLLRVTHNLITHVKKKKINDNDFKRFERRQKKKNLFFFCVCRSCAEAVLYSEDVLLPRVSLFNERKLLTIRRRPRKKKESRG